MPGSINVGSITDGTHTVTPEQLNKGRVLAWASIDSVSTVPTVLKSYNIAGVVDNGVGNLTINTINPLPDGNFVVLCSGISTTATTNTVSVNVLGVLATGPTQKNTTSVRVLAATASAAADPKEFYIAIIGA